MSNLEATFQNIDLELVKKVPLKLVNQYHIMPLYQDTDYIYIASTKSENIELKDRLETVLNHPIQLVQLRNQV